MEIVKSIAGAKSSSFFAVVSHRPSLLKPAA